MELAKSLLHRPRLLIMDEPTTGLDPSARSDVWNYIRQLQQTTGMTVFMTTHLLEEADHADRIAILHEGELVALDKPEALRRELGGDVIAITASDPESLLKKLEQHDGLSPQLIDGVIRISGTVNSQLVSDLHMLSRRSPADFSWEAESRRCLYRSDWASFLGSFLNGKSEHRKFIYSSHAGSCVARIGEILSPT